MNFPPSVEGRGLYVFGGRGLSPGTNIVNEGEDGEEKNHTDRVRETKVLYEVFNHHFEIIFGV